MDRREDDSTNLPVTHIIEPVETGVSCLCACLIDVVRRNGDARDADVTAAFRVKLLEPVRRV